MRCTELTFTDATRYFTAFVANEFNIIYILFNIISVCFNIYIIIIIRFNNPLDSASSLLYGHALTNFNLSILPAINRYRNIIMYIIYIMFQYYFHLLYNSIFYFSINHTIIIIIQSFIMQSFIYYLLILLYLVIISKPKSLSIYDLSSLVAISFSNSRAFIITLIYDCNYICILLYSYGLANLNINNYSQGSKYAIYILSSSLNPILFISCILAGNESL